MFPDQRYKISNKFRDKITLGPDPVLSIEAEKVLKQFIIDGYKKGRHWSIR